MRIVNIEDFFHPDAGYQINLLSKYFVKMGHEVHIVTSNIEAVPHHLKSFFGSEDISSRDVVYSRKYDVKIHRFPAHRFYSGRAIYKRGLYKFINSLKPDVLFIHGNDSLNAMLWLLRGRRVKYPIVMDSHMLSMASTNPLSSKFQRFYKKIFTPMIIKRKIPVIRTQNDPYVWEKLSIPLEQAPWISVGSDTMLFHPNEAAKRDFRQKHNIQGDAFVFVYAGKLDESKGGMLLANAVKEKIESDKTVVFLVVGDTHGEYGEKVERTFLESENRVVRLPTQRYEDLAEIYQASDVAVFPKQCSLSFYDVQACGLPVIFEDNDVNLGRSQSENTIVFQTGNMQALRGKIIYTLHLSDNRIEELSLNAYHFVHKEYNYMGISKRYLHILSEVVT